MEENSLQERVVYKNKKGKKKEGQKMTGRCKAMKEEAENEKENKS